MVKRLAACEPCRKTKVACGRQQPVCARCKEYDQSELCKYRDAPFKRRRHLQQRARAQSFGDFGTPRHTAADSPTSPGNYPNPGYLGRSSHAPIFEQLTGGSLGETSGAGAEGLPTPQTERTPQAGRTPSDRNPMVASGSDICYDVKAFADIVLCKELIHSWMCQGNTLPAAGIFVNACTASIVELFTDGIQTAVSIANHLNLQNRVQLAIEPDLSFSAFCGQFNGVATRWETLGIFLLAACRAAIDTTRFDGLFISSHAKREFLRTSLRLSDRCLETALSNDCLNDVQLLLQYENWIAHSMVDGDQSYHSWRKLGDVISSIYALGYHEQVNMATNCPDFIKILRSAIIARTFSGDKNVSIFLGRPHRMQLGYVDINAIIACLQPSSEGPNDASPEATADNGWFDHSGDSWWTAICAMSKEQVMDLSREQDCELRSQKASVTSTFQDSQWKLLPPESRLADNVTVNDGRSCRERDFLIGAELNHLHVSFLIEALLPQQQSRPSAALIRICARMLRIVTKAIVLKDHLVNSGTGLIWKVLYYGIPAAGTICLALLTQSNIDTSGASLADMIQDLGILVVHVETGALVGVDEPNYALVAGATRTIKAILHRVVQPTIRAPQSRDETDGIGELGQELTIDSSAWEPWTNDQFVGDFELQFWEHLGEHPELSTTEVDFAT